MYVSMIYAILDWLHWNNTLATLASTSGAEARGMTALTAPIARGTSCPGHVLVPWAHSPIWSRQHPIFVSLIQIAYYKR